MIRGRAPGERLLQILCEWVAAHDVSGRAVATYENFLAPLPSEAASDVSRPSPDQLGIVRNILGPTGAAVGRKNAGNEILLL